MPNKRYRHDVFVVPSFRFADFETKSDKSRVSVNGTVLPDFERPPKPRCVNLAECVQTMCCFVAYADSMDS